MNQDLVSIRRAYGEICRGYSITQWRDQDVYVKHLGSFDYAEIDTAHHRILSGLKARGIKTEADKLKWLSDRGLWTGGDDAELAREQDYCANLHKTKSILFKQIQIDQLDKQIAEAQGKIDKFVNRRTKLVGMVAERVADNKVQFEYIRLSFYRDKELSVPVFTEQDIGALSDNDSHLLLMICDEIASQFSAASLRRISISPFFTQYFYLCGDDLYAFFGRPLSTLSIYQAHLMTYGSRFRTIFMNNEIPKEHMDDPDKIEEYVTQARNAKNMLADTPANGARVGLVGMSKADFKKANIQDGTSQMQQVAAKGYTTAKDAAKDLGVTYR